MRHHLLLLCHLVNACLSRYCFLLRFLLLQLDECRLLPQLEVCLRVLYCCGRGLRLLLLCSRLLWLHMRLRLWLF